MLLFGYAATLIEEEVDCDIIDISEAIQVGLLSSGRQFPALMISFGRTIKAIIGLLPPCRVRNTEKHRFRFPVGH